MPADRRLARTAGILYLVTFVTSIPALALKTPFLAEGVSPELARLGGVLEVALAFACVGTALFLLPITRRVSEPLAFGFLASRLVEAGVILVGVIALLSLVTVGRDDPAAPALVAIHDWAFLLGPAVMAGMNALLLGSVLHRARLVPRAITLLGLVGGPILLASSIAVVFGAWTQTSPAGALSALPVAAWELLLGLNLLVRGTSAPTSSSAEFSTVR